MRGQAIDARLLALKPEVNPITRAVTAVFRLPGEVKARDGEPVTFRVHAEPEGGVPETLLQETYADSHRWVQRSVDLSHLVGQTVTLTLETDAQRPGTVALWAIPTLRETPTDSGSYRVLFLGNSAFGASGGIHQPFEGFCRATGLDCEAVRQSGESPTVSHGIEHLGLGGRRREILSGSNAVKRT